MAKAAFEAENITDINFSRGRRYLGGFIGSEETKSAWLGEKVEEWRHTVEIMAIMAVKFPQTVCAGFAFCLQNQWQYLQRVTADTGAFFAPLENAIRSQLAPALLGLDPRDIDGDLRQVLAHSVKMGGLALRNPVDMASHVHAASKATTAHLVSSLVEDDVRFDLGRHKSTASEARSATRKERLEREQAYLDQRGEEKPAVKRRDKRNCRAGIWLSLVPSRVNGTMISANEW